MNKMDNPEFLKGTKPNFKVVSISDNPQNYGKTETQLPTDGEIEEYANDNHKYGQREITSFIWGAKWMRDKIKNQ
mgnify:CR=1 FL=1